MIINRVILIFLLLAYPALLKAQNGISWLIESTPYDSVEKESFENHSSILPQIRQKINTDDGINFVKSINFLPLVDCGSNYQSELGFRINGGGIFESNQNWKKFYLRAGAIGGIESADSLTSAKYVFSDSLKSFQTLFQPIFRLSYTPNHIFNFQLGHDKNFLGEGNRSLFLSDFGKPYHFAQIRARFWHVEYLMSYQFFNEFYKSSTIQKFAAFHYLSWNLTEKINIGLFESALFRPKDTLLFRGFDVEYLNPVILFRPQEYSLGSTDNVILGASFSIKHKNQILYSQLVVDDFSIAELRAKTGWWGNKYGIQMGLKGFFKFQNQKFFYRLESNVVRPYTYAHLGNSYNYGNRNSPLAHPFGSNFVEVLLDLKWQHKKWLFKLFTNIGYIGLDVDGKNYGANIYVPYINKPGDYNHFIGQGKRNNFFRMNVNTAYKLSQKGSIYAFAELQYRCDSALNQKSNFIPFIGIRSYLWNDYRNY